MIWKSNSVSCLMGNIKNLSSLQQDKSSVSIIYHRHYALWSIDMKEEGGLLLFLDEMTMYVEISKVTW